MRLRGKFFISQFICSTQLVILNPQSIWGYIRVRFCEDAVISRIPLPDQMSFIAKVCYKVKQIASTLTDGKYLKQNGKKV